MCVSLTRDLYSGHVGCVCVCVCMCFSDWQPVFGSCRQGLCTCVCFSVTGDLYSGHVGLCTCMRVCVCFPDRRPVFGSCRQGLCMYVCMYVCVCVSLAGNLYSGHVGRVCVCVCFPRQGLYICICVSLTSDLSLCLRDHVLSVLILFTPPKRYRSKGSIRKSAIM